MLDGGHCVPQIQTSSYISSIIVYDLEYGMCKNMGIFLGLRCEKSCFLRTTYLCVRKDMHEKYVVLVWKK